MKTWIGSLLIVLVSAVAYAQDEALQQTLFTNVNVFDGTNEELAIGQDVLVEGNLIKLIGQDLQGGRDTTVIDGGGRTLMPGLIENHAHLMLMGPSLPAMEGMTTWEDFAIHGSPMRRV